MAARVQSKSANSTTGVTSLGVTLTSTPTTGNKIIGVGTDDGSTSGTFTLKDGNSTNLTNLSNQSFADNNQCTTALFAYDVPASPSTTFTLTNSNAQTDQKSVIVQEVSGLVSGNTSAMLDGTAGVSHGGTLTYTNPTYSSTASGEWLVAAFGDNGGPETIAANTTNGYTADLNNVSNVSGACDVAISYKNSTGGSENAGYVNMTGTACGWISILVAFKVAAGGTADSSASPPLTVTPLGPFRPGPFAKPLSLGPWSYDQPAAAATTPVVLPFTQAAAVPQPPATAQVVAGSQPGTTPYWWPLQVAAQPVPQPPPPVQSFVAPRAGIAPYWWPLEVAAQPVAQPVPTVQVVPGASPGIVETVPVPTVVQAQPVPQPPATVQVAVVLRAGTAPYWWPLLVSAQPVAQPPPAARVLWSAPAGVSPYWWPLQVAAAAVPQPPPVSQVIAGTNPSAVETVPVPPVIAAATVAQPPQSATVIVGLTAGQAAVTQPNGFAYQAAPVAQQVQPAAVLWSPRPGVSPYWWPLFVQAAPTVPQPLQQARVVPGITIGQAAAAAVLGWPAAANAIPQPPTSSQVLWAPRPGIAPYWVPVTVQAQATVQPALPAQVFPGLPVTAPTFAPVTVAAQPVIQPALPAQIFPGQFVAPAAPPPTLSFTYGTGNVPQPAQPARVGWAPRPGVSPYWVPVLVTAPAVAQPVPQAQVVYKLRAGTPPYWWPITVKADAKSQPPAPALAFTVFQPPPPFTIGVLTAGDVGSLNRPTTSGSSGEATDGPLATLTATDVRTGGPR